MSSTRLSDPIPLVPVVLAGGSGTRLWPASRSRYPKHVAPLVGDTSLLQQTVKRAAQICRTDRLLIIGAESQGDMIAAQLRDMADSLGDRLVLEPSARNTAAAVALAAFQAQKSYGDNAVLFVCPSDHLVLQPDSLQAALERGQAAVSLGNLVTFGIKPDRPETGFGYIRVGSALDDASGVHHVDKFVEKPERAIAQAMLDDGRHVWNSGMFLMEAATLLSELERFEPELYAAARAAFAARDDATLRFQPDMFDAIKSMPIDKAVMERSSKVAVVPCDIGWSDLGSWQALWETVEKGPDGNAVEGDVLLEDAQNNFVKATSRLVALANVANLAVVETADAVLVVDRQKSEGIKQIVAQLSKAGRSEADTHLIEIRPWGHSRRLTGSDRYRAVEYTIDPGATLGAADVSGYVFGIVVCGIVVLQTENETIRLSQGSCLPDRFEILGLKAHEGPAILMLFDN